MRRDCSSAKITHSEKHPASFFFDLGHSSPTPHPQKNMTLSTKTIRFQTLIQFSCIFGEMEAC